MSKALFSCQIENCAVEQSLPEDMLREVNYEPICQTCYDYEYRANFTSWEDLPLFKSKETKEIERLRSELDDAVAKIPVWQPIETAPKDGSFMLGWERCTTIPIPFHWSKVQHVPMYGWVDYSGEDDLQPTHWMPLPAPPQEDSK